MISPALEPAGVNHEQLVSQALGKESHLGLSIKCCYLQALAEEIKAAIKHLQKKHCGSRTADLKALLILIKIIIKKMLHLFLAIYLFDMCLRNMLPLLLS